MAKAFDKEDLDEMNNSNNPFCPNAEDLAIALGVELLPESPSGVGTFCYFPPPSAQRVANVVVERHVSGELAVFHPNGEVLWVNEAPGRWGTPIPGKPRAKQETQGLANSAPPPPEEEQTVFESIAQQSAGIPLDLGRADLAVEQEDFQNAIDHLRFASSAALALVEAIQVRIAQLTRNALEQAKAQEAPAGGE